MKAAISRLWGLLLAEDKEQESSRAGAEQQLRAWAVPGGQQGPVGQGCSAGEVFLCYSRCGVSPATPGVVFPHGNMDGKVRDEPSWAGGARGKSSFAPAGSAFVFEQLGG